MTRTRKAAPKKSLAHGRPPTAQKPTASLSSSATRSIIRKHHELHKLLHQAQKDGDDDKAEAIQQQIDTSGGLKLYQQASITGQSMDRGGDTSKQLMLWLEYGDLNRNPGIQKLKMLEIGALSPDNACSTSGLFEMTRIDLHSQHPTIQQQDFMEMPYPKDKDGFDIISLSLVLNYVPDAAGRGAMLRRTCSFLKQSPSAATSSGEESIFPALFIVLPKPCVTNSRYLTEDHLVGIMAGLGYILARKQVTAKLYYSLWTYDSNESMKSATFEKIMLNPGANRNNFTIILR